jgi:hypothetical protein
MVPRLDQADHELCSESPPAGGPVKRLVDRVATASRIEVWIYASPRINVNQAELKAGHAQPRGFLWTWDR